MKRVLVNFGVAAVFLTACGGNPVEQVEEPQAEEVEPVKTVEEEKPEVEAEPVEEKPEETTVEVVEEPAEETKEPEVNFDKNAFITALTKDMDDNFGDAGGTEEPMDWFKYITKYDVDYATKTVYAYTNIDTFNDSVTYDITNAMMNLINYDDQTYFPVKQFIVINAKGKEISVMNNRK